MLGSILGCVAAGGSGLGTDGARAALARSISAGDRGGCLRLRIEFSKSECLLLVEPSTRAGLISTKIFDRAALKSTGIYGQINQL
jgi:hypothetical protein